MSLEHKHPMLGIIGGLGPMATAYFMELIISMTDAKTDQEHIEMLVCNHPSTPDRTGYILGRTKDSPLTDITEMGLFLKESGADVLAIPCITAHYFHDELEQRLGCPVEHIVRETAQYLKNRNITRAGILATDGTVQTGLFQKEFAGLGIEAVVPDEENQKKVMALIYEDVKAGRPIRMKLFNEVTAYLKEQGAQVMILGCTELSMIKKDYPMPKNVLDAMEVLAATVVMKCGTLKPEYRELITR